MNSLLIDEVFALYLAHPHCSVTEHRSNGFMIYRTYTIYIAAVVFYDYYFICML